MDVETTREYSLRTSGALKMAMAIKEYLKQCNWQREKIYAFAILELITKSKENADLFISEKEIGFRSFEKDKKNKLVKCEAYFMEGDA